MKSLTYKDIRITFIGHAAFKISMGNIVIYIDPFKIQEKMVPADIILVSHGHYDHCDPNDIKSISKESTIIITTKEAKKKLKGDIQIIGQNAELNIKGITIKSMPAYNINKPYHPKGVGVGFIISNAQSRIYFAGDTDYTEEMKCLKDIDICLVPVGGKFTMDEKEASQFVNDIKPKMAIPMHYGIITDGDPIEFKKLTDAAIDVEIMG